VLDDVPLALPALTRAAKLQKRAARVGFDWADWRDVVHKIDEEKSELLEAIASGERARIEDEFGDLLFSCVNLARFLDIDPELALRAGNRKFERRFTYIEQALAADGKQPQQVALAELEALWLEAKQRENK
jgi:MazG family protein